MFNIAQYRKRPDNITDLLPWAALIAPGTVLNKDGSFQKTLYYRGPDLESSTESELVAFTAKLNNVLKRLGSGWALYVEAARHPIEKYPTTGHFPDAASWLIDLERRDLFERNKENFESQYYITFQYLPSSENATKVKKAFLSKQEKTDHPYDKDLEFFHSTLDRITAILNDFMYDVKALDDSETLSYLHQCISPDRHPIKMPEIPMYIDAIIADTPLIGGLEPQLGDTYLSTISILGFPSSSYPGILDQLNQLAFEYRWSTRFICFDKTEAESVLSGYKKRWFSKRKGLLTLLQETITKSESSLVDSASIRNAWDADEALQSLSDDHVAYGYYTATLTVSDKDKSLLKAKQREIERVINGAGFATIAETINAVDAWLSSLPGHTYANVRTPIVHTLNLAHFIPFSAVWSGPDKDKHLDDEPLFYARTSGNTPFRYVLHVGDVGHQMIVGPTGSGKSVLLNLIATQFLRYKNAKVFIFDKGQSFLASTTSVNGEFHAIGNPNNEDSIVFQPLKYIDDPKECQFALNWLIGLLINENVQVTPTVKETLWSALNNLANAPRNQRTMTGIRAFIQDQHIRSALVNYTIAGSYGHLYDSSHEKVSTGHWQCFEMEALMQTPSVIAPTLHYLFHQIEKQLMGQPALIILDEAWLFLDHPIFAHKIKEWLKTLRKHNTSVVFATQSIGDMLNTTITQALIESCPSRVFLPNPHAQEPSVKEGYERLGLNERQIEIINSATAKRHYYYSSTQGNTLFDLSLGKVALAICSDNTHENRQTISKLHKQYGNDKFLSAYLKNKKLNWALNIISEKDHEYI